MDISIIIVSWNVKELLRKCITSLMQEGSRVRYEVIVVDNASNDGTADEFNVWKSHFGAKWDFVHLISNKENRGFAAACNQGARIAKGSVLLFLNPDGEVQQGALQGVVQFFSAQGGSASGGKEHTNAGVMGGKIINSDGTVQPSVRRFPGFWDQLLILLQVPRMLGWDGVGKSHKIARPSKSVWFSLLASLHRFYATDFDYHLEAQVDQVMGAFFAVPKHVFEKLHGFDEQFFVWFEEVDFCKRVHEAGLNVYYSPHVALVHHGGASFKQVNKFRRRLLWLQSLWRYFRKHGFK